MIILRALRGVLLVASALIVAFWLSWHLLSAVNFGYSWLYQTQNIDAHIQLYGPQNKFKDGFETTSADEHARLFHAIVVAINNDGAGLADIQYERADGSKETLLREPEVGHLEDVAVLVSGFNRVAIACLALLVIISAAMNMTRTRAPSIKQIVIGMLVIGGGYAGFIFLVGPLRYFYWLHHHIFPKDSQWFFYYQESLMTTLMKAPQIFGAITLLWLASALLLFMLIIWGLKRFLRGRQQG